MNYSIETDDNIRYIVIPELRKLGLNNCFTTIDMDMRLKDDERIEEVEKNHKKIFKFMNIKPKEAFSSIQTHSRNIKEIKDLKHGKSSKLGCIIPDNDGFITNLENVALISKYADCTPIILYDPIRRVHSNIHSGWRGTLKRIGSHGVELMIDKFDSNPEDIIVVLGPSIDKYDFEVDIDVKNLFEDEFEFSREVIFKKDDIKYLIDLKEINKRILMNVGIREENITTIDLSTKSNPMLHSYRRDKENFGLMATITCLEDRRR